MFVLKGYRLSTENLGDNYDFLKELDVCPIYSDTGKGDTDVIPNVRVCIYKCPKECTLEEAQNAIIDKYYGKMSIDSFEYGYSEYTIEGFNIDKCTQIPAAIPTNPANEPNKMYANLIILK